MIDSPSTGTTTSTNAVELTDVSRRFRGRIAMDRVTLAVPTGSVFGLVGINGAGKTTLIRHLIGALLPQTGTVRVLGRDPITDRVSVLRRVGYLTEEDSLPKWANVGELLRFFRGIQPNWDDSYAKQLCEMFRLSVGDRLSSLSKGQRARVGLLAAIAHRPEVLILDEPSSGLDPIARGDILEAVIRTVNEDGRTVLFSSHLLDEVDRVCDSVAMIHEGRIVESITMERLQSRYREFVIGGDSSTEVARLRQRYSGSFGWRRRGGEWSALVDAKKAPDDRQPPEESDQTVEVRPATLDRWFSAHVAQRERTATEQAAAAGTEAEIPSHV